MLINGKTLVVDRPFARIARVAEGYEFVEDPEEFRTALQQHGVTADIFTFIPRISETSQRFDYPVGSENLAVLRVSTFEHWFTNQIGKKTRNMIRKGQKSGVTVREVPFDDALAAGICLVNDERPLRQGRRFSHYGDDLPTVRRLNGTFISRSVFLGAFLGDKLVGYAKVTSDENCSQAGLMQILSMDCHRDKAPTNLLIAEAVRLCARRKIPYLWYAKFAYGSKRPDGAR